MNKKIPEEKNEEKLPFSFQKKTVSEDEIAEHWQKIVARLAEKPTTNETDGEDTVIKYSPPSKK